jgi:hypothetical protein
VGCSFFTDRNGVKMSRKRVIYCPNFKGLSLTVNTDKKLLARLRCKQWKCEYCGEKNRKIWQAHLLSVLPEISEKWSFLTITCMPSYHRKNLTLEFIIKNFDRLMKRLKRQWGEFQYVRIYECHKSGKFHAHLLISYQPSDSLEKLVWRGIKPRKNRVYRGADYKIFKAHLVACGFGYQCDLTPIINFEEMMPVAPHVAVGYVTKYLTKNMDNLPKGTRRIQTSRRIGYPKVENEDDLVWQMRSAIYEEDVARYGSILDLTTGNLITFDDFIVAGAVYPRDEKSEEYHRAMLMRINSQ